MSQQRFIGVSSLRGLRQTEICDAHMVFRIDQNVRWFDIPVDDAVFPRRFEAIHRLPDDLQRLINLESLQPPEAISEILSLDILHDEICNPGAFTERIDPYEVRMVPRRHRQRFAQDHPDYARTPGS